MVQFTDQSTAGSAAITSWSWNFGDGGTSTSQNPSHTYTSAGSYNVSLTVSSSAGSDSETKHGYISVSAPPSEGEGEGEGEGDPETETYYLPGGVALEMVRIPAGSFLMGRYDGERSSDSKEDPQHEVNIGYDFYMGKYEVTQAQWLAVMGSWPGDAPSSTYGVGDNYPAYYVSWNDAQDFITALNNYTGQTFRLPSEAEWEYACRAGTQTRFYFGDSLDCDDDYEDCAAGVLPGNRTDYMWYQGNDDPFGSKPVGGLLPNGFGLFDMSGNVWEWCQDWYHSSYSGAPVDGSAWESPTGSSRVTRGGDWGRSAGSCRSAYRYLFSTSYRFLYFGFRLAR